MDQWDLSRVVKTEEEWKTRLDKLRKETIPYLASFKGKLGDKAEFKKYLEATRDSNKELSALYTYASMKSDLNKKDVHNSENDALATQVYMELIAATSFESPEVLGLGEAYVDSFFKENPELNEFDFIYKKLFHSHEHVLSAKEEALLADFAPVGQAGSELYSKLSVADRNAVPVTLDSGEVIQVTSGSWTNQIENAKTAEDRRKIFEACFSYFADRKNVYGEIYNTVVQSELAEKKARNFSSILSSHLFNNNIPDDVFLSLIKVASNGAEPIKKYIQLRKKYLGLSEYHTYDRFMQLAHSDKKYTFKEAKDLFWESIKDMPEDFQKKAHEVLKEGYVDVYEQDGKRGGAYSTGGSDIHPFILLNFQGGLDDCFTVAHESGHSIHTLYSEEFQPLMKQDYTIFVAEIASTFDEHNLLDYFIRSGKLDKNQKIMVLQKAIDEIMSTFYRQTLFAHFEYDIALKAEKGEPINYDVCNKEMIDLYQKYYGLDITKEKVKEYVWAYIPHLYYTPFYVYQYATSFSASMQLYKNVKEKKPGAVDKYLGLLKSGGSAYPVDEVKAAGVDLTDEKTFQAVVDRCADLVDELEKVLAE